MSLGLLGRPVGHSLSPRMQGAALAELAKTDPRFAGWRYFAFDIAPSELKAALDLMRERGFRGVNLTVPHKVAAREFASSLDETAREAGAVNTLVAEDGGWRGLNTDGYGLLTSIREDLRVEIKGAPVVLLGAGGAARGAAVECLRGGCSTLWLVNRTPSRLEALLADLAPLRRGAEVRGAGPDLGGAGLDSGAIIINATSLGLLPADPAPVDLKGLPGATAVYDMIYNPAETRLLAQARSLGLRFANGIGMLVHQGAKALEAWSGVPASATAPAMRTAAERALSGR